MSDRDKPVEILVLRHQITVVEHQLGAEKAWFSQVIGRSRRHCCTGLPQDVLRRLPLLVRRTRCCAGTATWSH
ncbi:hypothetical protein ABZS88_33095 [Streptomyces sp. NPDC005480]|uniref:hypothetical protein n=1 Tax=Streptomyces sp. NPDC005480 TaxID=3154880 RepID=UPI0033B464AB